MSILWRKLQCRRWTLVTTQINTYINTCGHTKQWTCSCIWNTGCWRFLVLTRWALWCTPRWHKINSGGIPLFPFKELRFWYLSSFFIYYDLRWWIPHNNLANFQSLHQLSNLGFPNKIVRGFKFYTTYGYELMKGSRWRERLKDDELAIVCGIGFRIQIDFGLRPKLLIPWRNLARFS